MTTAAPSPRRFPAGEELVVLAFALGERRFAVELARTREILRFRRPTPLPGLADFVEGVISVRGVVTPVLDLWRRLGLPPVAPEPAHRLVVANTHEGERAALRVEQVFGVRRLRSDDLRPPTGEERMLVGVAEAVETVGIVDLDAVLDLERAGA